MVMPMPRWPTASLLATWWERIRDAIVERLRFLGAFEVIVIKANEERVMALQALICLAAEGQGR